MTLRADTGYIVIAELQIEPQHYDAFFVAIQKNAAASTGSEAGCHHFEVSASPNEHRITLVEGYTDRAHFERHLQSAHFQEWKSAAAGWIQSRRVKHLAGAVV